MHRGPRRTLRPRFPALAAAVGLVVLILVPAVGAGTSGSTTVTPRPVPGSSPTPPTPLLVPAGARAGVSSLAVTLSIVPNPATAGTVVNFTATVSGGTPPYSYSWKGLPSPCPVPASNVSSFSCIPAGYSQTNVSVKVYDSSIPTQLYGSASVPLHVYSAITVQLTAEPNPVDAGAQLWVNSTISGGTPPYKYTWKGLPSHCSPSPPTTGAVNCTPSSSDMGTHNIALSVSDSSSPVNLVGTGRLPVRINNVLAINVGVDPSSGTVPFQVRFSAIVKGGSQPYGVTWAFPDGGLGSGTPWTHLFQTPGVFNVTLWVNDSANNHQVRTLQIVANAPPPKPGFLGFSGHTGYYVLAAILGGIALVAVAVLLWWRGQRKGGGPSKSWVPSSGLRRGATPGPPKPFEPPAPPGT